MSMPMPAPAPIEPTFVLSFDTELIWGSFDHTSPADFERAYPDVRGTIGGMLGLLERYEVAATWAVVGHLFLDSCERGPSGLAHSELARPGQSFWPRDWYAHDPCTDRDRDPLWYGSDILDALQAARVPQEIGCHSFGHPVFGDHEMTRDAASSDIAACVALAARRGIELRSFVFPRNSEGWHDVLREHGFRAFRGEDPNPNADWPRAIRRVAHFGAQVVGATPPVSRPSLKLPGLWNVPGSMVMLHRRGARRLLTRSARLRCVRAGIEQARTEGGVFHLWTHPFNLANDRPFMLSVLEDALKEVAGARDRGQLRIETMGSLADRMEATLAAPPTVPELRQVPGS